MNSLKQMVEREIKANPNITAEEFAAGLDMGIFTLYKQLKASCGQSWSQIKSELHGKKAIESRGDKALKKLAVLANNPDVKNLRQASELIGENHGYLRNLLHHRKLSWREMCETHDKSIIQNHEDARIIIPESLLMPLRSYRHSKAVYSNTEARLL